MSSSLRRFFGGQPGAPPSPRSNVYPRSDEFDDDNVDERRKAFSFLQPSPSQGSISMESTARSRDFKALAVAASNGPKAPVTGVKQDPSYSSNSNSFDFDFVDENPSLTSPSHAYSITKQSRKSIPPENGDFLNPFHPLNMKQRLDSQQFYSPRSEVNSHVSKPSPTTHRSIPPRQSGMSTVPTNSSMRASNTANAVPNSPISSAMSKRMMRRSDSSDMSDNDSFFAPINPITQPRPPRPQTSSSPTFASQTTTASQNQRYPPKPSTPSSVHSKNGSNNKDSAFLFDAFGLDEKEIDHEVTSALEAIAGSNPDFKFTFNFNDGGDVSVSSESPSLNSPRASLSTNSPQAQKKSPTFWDDDSDSSSFAFTGNNQEFSTDEFWAPATQNAYVPSNRQPQGQNSSVVKSSTKSPKTISTKEHIADTSLRSRFDSRALPDAFSNNSNRNEVQFSSPKNYDVDRDKTVGYGQSLKSRSSNDRPTYSQPFEQVTEVSVSPGRRRAHEWGREQKSDTSAWPPFTVQNDTSSSKSIERARHWATETPSVIHQRRAVVGDSAGSDVVFSDVNAVVQKMIRDGGQGFRPPPKVDKAPKTNTGPKVTGEKVKNHSEISSDKSTNEVTKHPMIELKGLSQAAELKKTDLRSLEYKKSVPLGESESDAHERKYVRPTDRSLEVKGVAMPKQPPSIEKEPITRKEDTPVAPDKLSTDQKEPDVASLIRQRIAANKKTVTVRTEVAQSNVPALSDVRSKRRKAPNFESGSGPDEPLSSITPPSSFMGPISADALDKSTSTATALLLSQSNKNASLDYQSPGSTSTQSVTQNSSIKNQDAIYETKEAPKVQQSKLKNQDATNETKEAPKVVRIVVAPIEASVEDDNYLSESSLTEDKRRSKSAGNALGSDLSYEKTSRNNDADQRKKTGSMTRSLETVSTDEEESDNDLNYHSQPNQQSDSTSVKTPRQSPPTEDLPIKTNNRASDLNDDKYQNIAAMLSQRSTNTSKSDASSKKNELSVSEEKKGILSSLLSRRKAHEEAPKDSSSSHISTSKTYGHIEDAVPNSDQLALKDDPLYQKYFMMLKIGMPMEVVKHALLRDGLDPSVMDGDFDKPAVIKDDDDGVPLKDDPRYAKYFKMIKMGLPLGAVKNCMAKDGEDPDLLDGDHNAPAKARSKAEDSSLPKEKDKFRRARVHWDSKGKVSSRSVWAIVKQDLDVDSIEIDDKEFESLFQAEVGSIGKVDQNARGKESSSKKNNAVKVIDPKRANNGGIVLARLKMSYDELASAVDSIDDSKLSSEQVQGIVGYIPSKDERNALRTYITSYGKNSAEAFENLCECEKFMVAMMTVKHSKEKMRALQFKLQFNQCLQYLVNDINTIERACEELRSSVRFRKLLGIVLSLGNKLNTAGRRQKGKVGSFTLQSLLKLHQTKAFDNKTTFLQYVVLVVERNDGNLSGFKEDIPSVVKAEKIFWDQCMSDLDELENQLQNVRKMALFEKKEKKRAPWAKAKKEEDDNLSDSSMTLEEEVAALRSTKIGVFALDAIKKVSTLMSKVESTKATFVKLLEYFGEEENKGLQAHSLFEIVVTFMKNYDIARKELITQGKLKVETQRTYTKKQSSQSSEIRTQTNQLPESSKIGQSVKSTSHETDNKSNNMKLTPSAPTMSSLMSDLMNHVKIRQPDQEKLIQSETNKKQQSIIELEKRSSSEPELMKPRLSLPPPPLPLQIDEIQEVEGSKTTTPKLISDPQSSVIPISTPSPTTNKLQSPNLPPAYFIPEDRSTSSSPHAFEANFTASDPEERDEVPFDQQHVANQNSTAQKPTLTRSERDSISNAQSTLRARRERLARRKLISR